MEPDGPDSKATTSISVCIPTLGRPSLVEAALPSVLDQLGPLDDVVVAFDGVEPGDADLFAHAQVRTVAHRGPSVGSARNAAVAASAGDVVVFLDDDDTLAPAALERYRAMFDDRQVVLGFGSATIGATDAKPARLHEPTDLGGLYCGVHGTFLAGTFAVRRDLFDQVGGYHEDLRFGENYDLGIRLSMAIADGHLLTAATTEVMVRCAPSGNPYRDARAHAARFTLESYPDLLAGLAEQRATLNAIVGVHAWGDGDRAAARASFRAAAAARPLDVRHVGRLLVSYVGPVGDRVWLR